MDLPLKWEFPGGKVEENEALEACLKREIREEMGVEIKILNQLPSQLHVYSSNKAIELIPFRCRLLSSEINLKEHLQIKWLEQGQLEKLDWAEADVAIVKYYIENYK